MVFVSIIGAGGIDRREGSEPLLGPNQADGPDLSAIRKRSLATPWSAYYGEGTKQKNILGVRRVVESLIELCTGYAGKDPGAQKTIRQKAYSQLAFYLAYQEPDLFADQAGTLKFPFPKEDGTVGQYVLDETIDFGGGLKAFGFRGLDPSDPPLMIFHGTHMKSYSSGMGRTVIADLDPFGVGRTHYQLNEDAIQAWLQKATNNGQNKAIVCGHSLGGCFATYDQATVFL